MASDKDQAKPYKPEHPADAKTVKKDQQEIREAAKHAAQEAAAEELGNDDKPISREQAEKELHEAARKVQQEHKKGK
ncbi:MAG: hypothetical protein JO215_00755 [Ktedonobacteraceae bacterium]|nr:hypothetical protein [Ktedonobacteraceae bacterium]MBV9710588.1 hypothetical protein [Ktedonobacteraceae bacterium]